MSDPAVVETKKQNIMNSQTVWPGAFGAFKYSKSAVMLALKPLLVLTLGYILLSWAIAYPLFSSILSQDSAKAPKNLPLSTQVVWNIAAYLFSISVCILLLRASGGKKINLTDALKSTLSLKLLVNYVLLQFIFGGLLLLSALLLLIPVLFWGPRLALTLYYLIDQKMNCLDAISASWKATKGHGGKVWGIIGAGFVMFLPAITIIGAPVAIYLLIMYQAAFIVLYQNIKTSSQSVVEPVAVV